MKKILSVILKWQKKRSLRKLKRRGVSPEQESARKVVTGELWEEFCDTLKDAGGSILGFESPDDPQTRAEGFRYLSRLIRAGLENFVETGNPQSPVLRRLVHETVKMGNDNPDFYYRNAVIDGRWDYRILGSIGSTQSLIISTQEGDYTDRQGAAMPLAGQLASEDMVVDADGNLEIILSQEKKGTNWLRTTADTKMVMVRELFGDRDRETPCDLRIELLDPPNSPPPFTPGDLEDGLEKAGQLVAGASLMFARWSRDFAKTANSLPRFDQAKSDAAGGDPLMAYYHSSWRLDPGQALVIEAQVPQCLTWNCVLANHWLESLDYRYGRIHVNKHTAAYRPDGSVRIIIAHENPGLPNWLDPQGHDFGALCFRWNRADSHPQPTMRSIPLAHLEDFRQEETESPSRIPTYRPTRAAGEEKA